MLTLRDHPCRDVGLAVDVALLTWFGKVPIELLYRDFCHHEHCVLAENICKSPVIKNKLKGKLKRKGYMKVIRKFRGSS
jgi:hypothetical protein